MLGINQAWAQAGAAGGEGSLLGAFLPLILVFFIFYFLMIRPQQKRMKAHKEMVENLRRGDAVVTSGGIIGKIARVQDDEVQVEVAENVKIRVLKQTISEVRNKTEPASSGNDAKS